MSASSGVLVPAPTASNITKLAHAATIAPPRRRALSRTARGHCHRSRRSPMPRLTKNSRPQRHPGAAGLLTAGQAAPARLTRVEEAPRFTATGLLEQPALPRPRLAGSDGPRGRCGRPHRASSRPARRCCAGCRRPAGSNPTSAHAQLVVFHDLHLQTDHMVSSRGAQAQVHVGP